MLRKILIAATALVALMAAPAAAQYTSPITLTISDTQVVAGQAVVLSGTCDSGDTVVFTINGQTIGSAPVLQEDAKASTKAATKKGDYETTVTIPSLAPGTYSIVATCGGESTSVDFEVMGTSTTPTTPTGSSNGPVARTGTGIDNLVRAGGILLVFGGLAVLIATKRRRSRPIAV